MELADTLTAARWQMATSLGFHIVFACIGMVMPFLMVISHYKWLKTNKPIYLEITKAWQKGVAIFFVTGAVSGTVLSFELGLLWPTFMKHAGPIIGMPFSLEGAAFFTEAIAFGFYLYGWNKIKNKWFHWFTGVIIGVSGVASGILVVSANGWMNCPSGFDFIDGQYLNVDPIGALLNPAWFTQALHMVLAAFTSVGFGVAGLHAIQILRRKRVEAHKQAFKIAMIVGSIAALLQPISGDISAKDVAERQPVKLAALEAHYETEKQAPLRIGGIVDEEKKEVTWQVEIPGGLSFLAFGDLDAEVKGLNDFPKENLPPVGIVHYAFQLMVMIGSALACAGLLFLVSYKFKTLRDKRWFWWMFALLTPAGFLAVEAGWVVTEVGRQPWIIYNIMRTADAVTPMKGIGFSMIMFLMIYFLLAFAVTWLMRRQFKVFNAAVEEVEAKNTTTS